MRRIANILIFVMMMNFSSQAFGSCDFSTGVKESSPGVFTYSYECHVEVGRRLKELDLRRQQVDELNKAITLKDLAIAKADERAKLWMDTSNDLSEKLMRYDSVSKRSETLYFVGGIAVTIMAVWAAGQLRR